MPGWQDDDASEASDAAGTTSDETAEAPAATALPTTPEPDPSPVLTEEPAPDAQASFSLENASPTDTEDAPHENSGNDQDIVQDTLDVAQATAPEPPAQNINLDPLDIAAVTATEAQRMRIKRLRKFRRLDVGTVFAGGSSDAVARAHDKLQTLRDRLAIDLDRR